jgi:short-subunit dehydrogenase
MAVYYATKAYVLSFSEALHQELKPRGVRVTALCPGPVPTGFQARAGIGDDVFPSILTRSAESVARQGYRGLKAGRRVVVPGLANKMVPVLARVTVRPILLAVTHAIQKDRRTEAPAPAPANGGSARDES